MATQICNNDGNNAHVFGHKPEGLYQAYFRRRKPAFRTKPATGIPVKKHQTKRKLESSDFCRQREEEEEEDDFKRTKTAAAAYSYSDFESLGMIGRGSYGAVYKVRHDETGEIMAMKEECGVLSPTALMEIDILKTLPSHPSIVAFHGVAVDAYGNSFLLMEYMDTDLRTLAFKEERFSVNQVKTLMKQLLEGVNFLHQNGVMHRDLKPENILINSRGDLKICDFGMAIWFGKEEKGLYSPRVGTLCYRAPELLLEVGAKEYSCEVDMWSVGCIMAELVWNRLLFNGVDEMDQLDEIYSSLAHLHSPNIINSSSANFVLSEDGFDLLEGLLTYDKAKRITAEAALKHVWFHENN